jgi:hypothetical protein
MDKIRIVHNAGLPVEPGIVKSYDESGVTTRSQNL